MVLSSVVPLCVLGGGYKYFGETLPSSLGLKMEAVYPSKTLLPTYKVTLRHNRGDHHGHLNRLQNLKSQLSGSIEDRWDFLTG
jgi:hypothetical protein